MKASSKRCLSRCLASAFALILLTSTCAYAQSVWTWHNDNWRTGQDTAEMTLTLSNVNKTNFGQICSAGVDGQIYAQPLVLANVTVSSTLYTSAVYVVTQNDSVYLFDGTNCNLIASAVTGTSTSLIPSGETAVDCPTSAARIA